MSFVAADNKLTEAVIQSIIRVHQRLGPGFKESIYRNALIIELANNGLSAGCEKETVVYYEGHVVGRHRPDLLVNDELIVELKTVEEIAGVHYAQVRSYLKATRKKLALLVNFASDRADYRRVESN